MDFYLSKAVTNDELNTILADAFSKQKMDFLIIDGSLFNYFDENDNCSIEYSEGDPRILVEFYTEKVIILVKYVLISYMTEVLENISIQQRSLLR